MRLLEWAKDGGPESPVDAFFIIELKSFFSIAVLRFNQGRRETYHSHAFNALTWFLTGDLEEEFPDKFFSKKYKRSFKPKLTRRGLMHRVLANKTSWCITLRGPWRDRWQEYSEIDEEYSTLTHHRRRVED